MKLNTKQQFHNLRPGAIIREIEEYGYYAIVTREHLDEKGNLTNAMLIDSSLSSVTIGERVYFRPTEKVHYLGYLGLNWRPDEF